MMGVGTTEQSAVVRMAPIGKKKKSLKFSFFYQLTLPLEQNMKSHVWDNNVDIPKSKQ